MATSTVKYLDEWQLAPVHGSGCCLLGLLDGRPWQTTIVQTIGEDRIARTASGSRYHLGRMVGTMWPLMVAIKRPRYHRMLQHAGIL